MHLIEVELIEIKEQEIWGNIYFSLEKNCAFKICVGLITMSLVLRQDQWKNMQCLPFKPAEKLVMTSGTIENAKSKKIKHQKEWHNTSHILLAKASHMVNPDISGEGKYNLTMRGSKYFKQLYNPWE